MSAAKNSVQAAQGRQRTRAAARGALLVLTLWAYWTAGAACGDGGAKNAPQAGVPSTPSGTGTTHVLTVAKVGSGTGTITGLGISCGADCSEAVAEGVSVTLRALPDPGASLAGWMGCDTASGDSCTVSVAAARTVTASFSAGNTARLFGLAVALSGAAGGRVTGPGIDCGTDCAEDIAEGMTVTLTAAPGTSGSFSGWSGCDALTGTSCTVAMNSARTVTASFVQLHQLTVTRSGDGSGTVVGEGVDCGADCDAAVVAGASVTLTATAAAGSVFDSWQGCDSASASTCSVTMGVAKTVTAVFKAKYLLRVAMIGTGTGEVLGTGIDCGTDCTESVVSGTSVTLKAWPLAITTSFTGWTNCDTVNGTSCTVTMSAARQVTATFTYDPPNVTFAGGTLAGLEAVSSTLEFGALTLTGQLELGPSDGPLVRLRAETITLASGSSIVFAQLACSYEAPPRLELIASGAISVRGDILLNGKHGEGTSVSTTCHQCDGVQGGTVVLSAGTTITVHRESNIDLSGGWGSHFYAGGGIYVGCDGGDGGVLSLQTAGTGSGYGYVKLAGGDYGLGGGGGGNGQHGVDGALVLSSSVTIHEYITGDGLEHNALVSGAQVLLYQPFTLAGGVLLSDDLVDKGKLGALRINKSDGTSDFCEDLFLFQVTSATTLHFASTASADIDIYLTDFVPTTILAGSQGATGNESISYSAAPGTYVLCVSLSDDYPYGSSQPFPYTIAVGS